MTGLKYTPVFELNTKNPSFIITLITAHISMYESPPDAKKNTETHHPSKLLKDDQVDKI